MEMLALMHEAQPYGHLMIAGRHPTDTQLSALVGAPPDQIPDLVRELEAAGVFSRTREKVIFSRRMVADDKKARISRKNGKSGGNPNLRKQKEIQPWDNHQDKGGDKTQKPEARYQNTTTTPSGCVSAQEPSGGWEAVRDRYWDSIASVFGDERRPGWPAATDRVTVQRWLDAGATPDLIADVTHDHLSRMAARNRAPPRSMACFDQDIADAIATAKKPLEAANARQSPRSSAHRPHSRASSDEEVRAALAAAVADRMGTA